ncbi:membrane protein [Azorhizobium oxalatiphilum]|uniref:Membrane protein n=1 Tax=Azorhizobium oxalatiphilum TaxID=980631 RepID=A0A917F725_9HYPH|nr:DMT family transporter [Azorhizobium oxalatiphilum]GGF53783.1 membrane protein [Azorhizobium oxalatiphilum]
MTSTAHGTVQAPRSPFALLRRHSTPVWLTAMVILWGLSWPATKLALDVVPPLWLAAIRFGSAGICLFLFVGLRGELHLPRRNDWPIVLSIGFMQMMAFTGMGMVAMTHTDTSRAVLLAYTTPLWSVLLAWLLFREAPTRLQFLALAVGLAGVALICSPAEMDWRAPGTLMGAGLLLAGAICWSAVILHIRRHRWQSAPLALAPWQMLLATVPLAILAYATEGSPAGIPVSTHLLELLVFIGPVATSACFVISAEHGRRISAFAMANFTLGVPLIGVVSSVIVLGNRLSPAFFAGLSLVIAGMLLAAYAGRAKSRTT